MALHDIGVVGMAVMGSNLALNMADHGYDVSVYNYTPDLTEQFLQERPHEKITGYFELKDFLGDSPEAAAQGHAHDHGRRSRGQHARPAAASPR